MKTVLEAYGDLWPQESREQLASILSLVPCIELPADQSRVSSIKNPSQVLVVAKDLGLTEISNLLMAGFEEFVQRDRPDFASELLASSLMLARPKAFLANPIPFFFNGFGSPQMTDAETNFTKTLTSTKEKGPVLADLEIFLGQNNRMAALTDLAIQVADEMMMNAFFSGPVDGSGVHLYQNEPRSNTVKMPPGKPVKVFAAYSNYRVIIGCQDVYGSMDKRNVLTHLVSTFQKDMAAPRTTGAGAGLGFKYMLENSANFYLFCQKSKFSLVACGFLLQGFKANLSSRKHVHVNIR